MTHTPGPWNVVEAATDGLEFFILPAGPEPAIAEGLIEKSGRRIEESRANAALLAASPDLLAALKDVLRIAKAASIGVSGNGPRIAKAEAAIARAEVSHNPWENADV